MNCIEAAAERAIWVGRNIAYNLEFIPNDKLDWKPASSARSVLEIIDHAASVVHGAISRVDGGDGKITFSSAQNCEEAQSLILSCVSEYSVKLKNLTVQQWQEPVSAADEEITWGRMHEFIIFDLCHHHGQISYIQSLLGDADVHFQM